MINWPMITLGVVLAAALFGVAASIAEAISLLPQ